jgi:DNA-binding MarR family transcriptional regulator
LPGSVIDKQKNSEVTKERDRRGILAHLLFDAARRHESRIIELIGDLGHVDVRSTHLTVIRNLDLKGTRITELALRAGITKQSMSDRVQRCEDMGFVGRSADETDRRAKKIIFTNKGRELVEDIWNVVDRVDEEMAVIIGRVKVTSLQNALKKYLY